jgi:hypothetical protein
MRVKYEDRGDGLYRCVDCGLGFHAWHPSGAKDAAECCPHRKYQHRSILARLLAAMKRRNT